MVVGGGGIYIYRYEHEAIQKPISENNIGAPLAPQKSWHVTVALMSVHVQAFLGASPDALIECNCCGQGCVEVKCSLCAQERSLEEAADAVASFCLDVLPTGKRNHPYYFQVQLQMFASKRGYCDFVV